MTYALIWTSWLQILDTEMIFYYYFCCTGVHCDIYEGTYNLS